MKGIWAISVFLLGTAAASGLAALCLHVYPRLFVPEAQAGEITPIDDAPVSHVEAPASAPEAPPSVERPEPPRQVATETGAANAPGADEPEPAAKPDAEEPLYDLLAPFMFEPRSTQPSPEQLLRLVRIGRHLEAHPADRLLLTGYAPRVGTDRYNRYMAKQRARVLRDALAQQGISSRRMRTAGVVLTRRESLGAHPNRVELRLQRTRGRR